MQPTCAGMLELGSDGRWANYEVQTCGYDVVAMVVNMCPVISLAGVIQLDKSK